MIIEFSGQTALAAGGAATAMVWFFWNRYQALEKRLTASDKDRAELTHRVDIVERSLLPEGEVGYRIHGNAEQITHKFSRMDGMLKGVEARLSQDIKELKGYLSKTTDFGDRRHE
ncbi:MAG: hypothetical protein AAGC54_19995 [Cyanobacteria bacterium P01_F01_bin.4]